MNEKERFRILVVDDEVSNIDILNRILSPLYNIMVAKTGDAAIQKAIKNKPDLILLDVIMPDMSGFDVISVLKDTDATQNIPIIFITGLDDSENEEKGLLLGAVDYIVKPFNNSIVRARVNTHLKIAEYINTIEHLCRIDALTNIPNRRHFNLQLETEWDRAARYKSPISLLMIDIDYFKKYNDTHGHPAGDALLISIAVIFDQALNRPADFVSRWGGEEFAILLPETDLNGALTVAEHLRNKVEGHEFVTPNGLSTKVTISIGVNSEIPANKNDTDASLIQNGIESFLTKADNALYDAKSSGRNCVKSNC